MVGLASLFAGLVLLASCSTVPSISPAARAELAPTGKLRVGINFGNTLLTARDSASGAPGGVAVDLARELGHGSVCRSGLSRSILPGPWLTR